MKNKTKNVTADSVLGLVQCQYMNLDEAGVAFESAEGGYQTAGTGAVSSDDLVDYLLDGTESDERDEMIAVLDDVSMEWIKR